MAEEGMLTAPVSSLREGIRPLIKLHTGIK